jgi:hypothetical protein
VDKKQVYARLISHGWTEHLISIVPPGARLAPGSTLSEKDLGKVPGRLLLDGTWSGFARWTESHATEQDILRWQESNGNVGLIIRNVRPIDFDCPDAPLVEKLLAVLTARFGLFPWRGRSNSAHGMAFFRSDTVITGKLVLKWDTGRIEIPGIGCQAVIEGTHPSGVEYTWSGLCSLLEAPVEALPHLPEADLYPLLDAFRAVLEAAGHVVEPVRRLGSNMADLAEGRRYVLGHPLMLAKDFAQAGRALLAIPHSDDYDETFRRIAAFYGAVGGDRAAIDEYLVPWLESWTGGENAPAWIEQKLASLSEGTSVGVEALFRCARTWGFSEVPIGTFEKVEPPPASPDNVVTMSSMRERAEAHARRGQTPTADPDDLPRTTLVGHRYTDQQLAMQVWDDIGDYHLRLHPSGQWLRWDKNVWVASEDAAAHLVRQYLGSIVRGLDEGKQGELLANRIEGAAMADRILKILRQRATRAAWDVNPEHLNTPAGLIDLRTGERRPARHDDYVRSCTAVAPDPGYPALYMQTALEIFSGDFVLLQAWLDHMALSLVNRRLTSSMLILEGSGRNGKSLLLDVVWRMFGDRGDGGYAVRLGAPDMFDARRTNRNNYSDLADLDGARATLFSEVDENFQMDEALLKAATAGERLLARRIYKQEFKFNYTGTITLAANVKVNLTSAPAMRQRVHTIRLIRQFAHDRDLYDAVIADAPKVLGATITRCTEILRGAETFWLPTSWGPSRQRFETMRRASEERFVISDPVNAAVRALAERDVNGRAACRVLFRAVREMLEAAARDDAADERLVEAAALGDRVLANRISNVVRDEFGETSVASHGQRFYRRVALKRNPGSPFTGE